MRTPHTSAPRGKRVFVVMKDGKRFTDKFIENTGNWVIFEDHRVRKGDIRVFAINRK